MARHKRKRRAFKNLALDGYHCYNVGEDLHLLLKTKSTNLSLDISEDTAINLIDQLVCLLSCRLAEHRADSRRSAYLHNRIVSRLPKGSGEEPI